MDGPSARVTIDRIDYGATLRFTRLFDCFGTAIHPPRLLLGLLLIIAMFITGTVMDQIWGGQVLDGRDEFDSYVSYSADFFGKYYSLASRTPGPDEPQPLVKHKKEGVFATAMSLTISSFESTVKASVQLRPGFDQLDPTVPLDGSTVVGALRKMVMIPVWLWKVHFGFFVVYTVIFTAIWSLLGGAISRLTIVEAARAVPISPASAVRFAARRWLWFALSPFIPLMLVGLCWGVLVVGGLMLNLKGLNVIGGFLFPIALAIGFVMAIMLAGWIAGVHMIYPAISAEGSDGFDAMSRAYSYVLARPWRLLLYSLVSLVYGAVTYLFVGLFIFMTIYFTHKATGTLVGGTVGVDGQTTTYFNAIMPQPRFGQLIYTPEFKHLDWPGKVTATLILVWVYLLIGLLGAYAISFYFSSYSTIYLLLRRYTDGTDPSEIYQEPADESPFAAKDKIEPKPAAPVPKTILTPVLEPPAPLAEAAAAPPDIEEADNT